MSTEERILSAIESGEILLIRYHGGSDPGSVREILPVMVRSRGKVKARCYTSKAFKDFKIEKIEILQRPTEVNHSDIWSPNEHGMKVPSCSKEMLIEKIATWETLGWGISNFDEPDGSHFGINLHRKKKVGAGHIKKATLTLAYRRYVLEVICQPDGSMVESTTPRQRPWVVASADKTRTFAKFDNAVDAFLDLVSQQRP